jgi:hypothetical protein
MNSKWFHCYDLHDPLQMFCATDSVRLHKVAISQVPGGRLHVIS